MEFFKLSRVKFGFAAALFLLLGACSFLPPFIDCQRNAGVHDISKLYVGRSTPENPAVCYNGWTTTYDEVKKLADEECRKHKTGTHAEPTDMTSFTCRLLIPNHIYFRCVQ